MNDANERPRWEVADVIRSHGEAFLRKYGSHLRPDQKATLNRLTLCRTAALGGHSRLCLQCGHEQIAYNSCRNRHCPKCQALSRARWLERESKLLLPVEYFHVVFTLPQEVAALVTSAPTSNNAKVIYSLLFEAASATLREVAANPKRLGAKIGVLAVLHTWGQNLHHHPHLHCVVTGGGPSCDAKGKIDASPRWVSCRPGFFLPVRVLGRVFRGKFADGLRRAFAAGALTFEGALADLKEAGAFASWLTSLCRKEWVVYAKPPFGGPERTLKYLARYTHRVAISNSRILDIDEAGVKFQVKDYADGGKSTTTRLTHEEFLRRFSQHILPRGFVKIRHYGLLANHKRKKWLRLCRCLLLPLMILAAATLPGSVGDAIAPALPESCSRCGGMYFERHLLGKHFGDAPVGAASPSGSPPTASVGGGESMAVDGGDTS